MKKLIKVGLITGVVVLLALQLLLPGMFAQKLKTGLADQLRADRLEIEVDAFPAVKVFGGRVDRLQIDSRQLLTDKGLKIKELTAAFTDLKFEQKDESWQVVEGQNSYLYLLLTESAINNYLATVPELKLFERFKVSLTTDQVVLRGVVSFFSTQIQVQLSGDFTATDQKKIVFSSHKLAVENVVVPEEVINQLKNKLQFKVDLTTLPFPLQVKQVKVNEDQLEVRGPEKSE